MKQFFNIFFMCVLFGQMWGAQEEWFRLKEESNEEQRLWNMVGMFLRTTMPILFAVQENSIDVIMPLIDRKADPYLGNPVLQACKNDNHEMVKTLIAAGVDIKRDNDKGRTLWAIAASRKNIEMMEILVCEGVDTSYTVNDTWANDDLWPGGYDNFINFFKNQFSGTFELPGEPKIQELKNPGVLQRFTSYFR